MLDLKTSINLRKLPRAVLRSPVGKYSHNKLFKSDSQRVAFLLCVAFSVLGGMRKHRYCVAHTLTGRYVTGV
ncbi:DUF3265 domain-containing protein [Vibrio parahaemolyticus]|nr:DUF3265 domain-containing protein [Vibrio parahaemolyticus]ELB2245073.1 DUF3265 domain-containing protein [Vibrio parahaemolyticus]HCE2149635.1 DUF3265 domain-containing protein [Vibrio parahaemolyticus]